MTERVEGLTERLARAREKLARCEARHDVYSDVRKDEAMLAPLLADVVEAERDVAEIERKLAATTPSVGVNLHYQFGGPVWVPIPEEVK